MNAAVNRRAMVQPRMLIRQVSRTGTRRCRLHAAGSPAFNPLELSMNEVLVGEIMVPHPVTFKANQSIKEAARIMIEKDVPGGPVVDDDGNLIGVLTEDDLMWKGAGAPTEHYLVPPIFIGAFDLNFFLRDNKAVEEELRKVLAKRVSDAMTSKAVVSIEATASMALASQKMLLHHINSLPVVEGTKVVGVVSRHDVLRALIATRSPLLELMEVSSSFGISVGTVNDDNLKFHADLIQEDMRAEETARHKALDQQEPSCFLWMLEALDAQLKAVIKIQRAFRVWRDRRLAASKWRGDASAAQPMRGRFVSLSGADTTSAGALSNCGEQQVPLSVWRPSQDVAMGPMRSLNGVRQSGVQLLGRSSTSSSGAPPVSSGNGMLQSPRHLRAHRMSDQGSLAKILHDSGLYGSSSSSIRLHCSSSSSAQFAGATFGSAPCASSSSGKLPNLGPRQQGARHSSMAGGRR
ncbi:hypothetical protein FOA52_005996 [Chlamydomonas sp. UWO 241]|nr:hypothetical protein FOA52_005996 [Chlamydomonas sp. UWO 241]